ncbi:unnamed protein product [Alopecurus aequalis]
MAMAAPAHTEPPGSTTVDFSSDSMPEDVIQEILLRFPCSASVACAVYFNKHLRGMVSNDEFLKRFRQRHPSSPLLGIFASGDKGRLPLFENLSSDAVLNRVICRTDTGLGCLDIDKKKDWLLEDCRNGLLLMCSNDNSFCIYDPLSQRRVDCESRPYELDGKYLDNCLLYGPSLHMVSVQQCRQLTKALESSFRVISLQRRRRSKSTLRAVEYDSRTLEWRPHPWKKFQSLEWVGETMHAAGHIFWACSDALLIVLDTKIMKFSQEPLPGGMTSISCAIGELEDGKACAVCLKGLDTGDIDGPIDPKPHLKVRLQVWTIDKKNKTKGEDEDEKEEEKEEEGRARFDWKLTEDFFVSEILEKDARVYQVTKVVNGLVILSNNYSKDHYVINLHSKTQVAKFNNRGRQMPYLYQVPWPPSVMAATVASGHNKHIVGDEVNTQSPINKDVPSTIEESYGHIAGNEVSKQCPSNKKDGPATTEER